MTKLKLPEHCIIGRLTALLMMLFIAAPLGAQQNSLIKFTENKKQWDSKILYSARLDGGELFLEKNCLTYNFYDKELLHALHLPSRNRNLGKTRMRYHAYKVYFEGARSEVNALAIRPTHDYCNYYLGNDYRKWATKVKNYKEVNYFNLYEGIDMQMLGLDNSIKYNFYVKPGANASSIRLRYEGLQNIALKKGELQLSTSLNEITEHRPYAWQIIGGQKKEVPCKFVLKEKTLSFAFPAGYQHDYELVIDPLLVFACSSGSTADNFGMTATYDYKGNLYSGGTCFNAGYPVTTGAYDATYNGIVAQGRTDVVITKYDSSGTFLQYSTYLGGSTGSEIVTSLVVDIQDNLFLYGATGSSDFPVTANAYDQTFNGGTYLSFFANGTKFGNGTDIYVSKFNSAGSALLASTYLGGSKNDGVNHNNDTVLIPSWGVWEYPLDSLQFNYGDQYRGEIQTDKQGNCYISSSSRSADFPVAGGFDNTLGGQQDAVVVKFDPNLSQLLWSSFLGGSDNDAGYALTVDDSLQVYLTGGTRSSDFPASNNAAYPTYNGGKADGYIAKISSNGSTLIRATFIGTGNYDQSYFVQNDKQGNVYVLGQSLGAMPVQNVIYSNANGKQFITKFNNSLSNIIYSTVIGSGGANTDISPSAFLIDYCEKIYLSGWGGNIITGASTTGMPLSNNAYNATTDGFNFYLMVLDQNASSLIYATYFGGAQSTEHVDGGTSRFDKRGIIYQSVCAGCGGHDDFPVTPGSWPNTGSNVNHSTNCNNGTFKFDFQIPLVKADFNASYLSGCAPLTVNFSNQSTNGAHYLWNFGGNDTTSLILNPVKTYSSPGTYLVQLYVVDSTRCNISDSTYTYITVYPALLSTAQTVIDPCSNSVIFNGNATGSIQGWWWNFGDGQHDSLQNTTHNYNAPGTYNISLIVSNSYGCKDTTISSINVLSGSVGVNSLPVQCFNQSGQLTATGGIAYTWTPATGLSAGNIANPWASPDTTTTYQVHIISVNLNGDTCMRNLSTTVQVLPKITADFNYTISPCGNSVQFTDSSYVSPVQWNWNFGDNNSATTTNPNHSYNNSGTYTVSLIAANAVACEDTIQQIIVLPSFNPLTVSASQTTCAGSPVQLTATGGVAYSWTPAAGLSATNINNPLASPVQSTTYSVTITSISSTGDTCLSTLSTAVNVAGISPVSQILQANPDTIIKGNSTSLSSSLSAPYAINWSPSNTLNNPAIFNPTATPTHTTTYTAIVTDINGCTYIMNPVTVYVIANACDESSVFVPNTFTPNGDGKNDILYARSNVVQEIYFALYNRWGQLVFETTDLSKGWDGVYKGMKADPGVFGYYLKVKCNNGEESFRKGNVSLIR